MELHFATRNYQEGLREINLIFRLFIDHRRTVEAEYYRFREHALKNIITTMSRSKNRDDLVFIETLLSEYFEEQEKVAETLRGRLYDERGKID